MLNALIAMMSQTCSNVSEDRFPLWRIQQLSVILVIEDIMCLCCFQNILSSIKKKVCGLDPITKQRKFEERYIFRNTFPADGVCHYRRKKSSTKENE